MALTDLKSLTYNQLNSFITNELGEAPFRTKQIFSWLHKGVTSFDEMSDLSKALRQKLSQTAYISKLDIERKQVSKLDSTTKYLFRLDDGNCIETVVMYYKHGISVCVSSQVGCAMGCRFCASTIGGKVRSLNAGEILDQILFAQKDIGERISNIVMMGIGEPLDNYDNVITFLQNVNHPDGVNIGYRHISLSTCGLVDKIYKLADENLPITLSVSLHAPNDEIRNSIMPVNGKYNIHELITACKAYLEKTGRRISFEYSLISGVNDSVENARELAHLLKGMLCHINLIPVNSIEERRDSIKKSTNANIIKFRNELTRLGMNATVRRELGSDIDASCGQLRKKSMSKTKA